MLFRDTDLASLYCQQDATNLKPERTENKNKDRTRKTLSMKTLNFIIAMFSNLVIPASRLQLLPLPGQPPVTKAEELNYFRQANRF